MFDFLFKKSNIGNYNKCEIIEILELKKILKYLLIFSHLLFFKIRNKLVLKILKLKNFKDLKI